jgi:hypothetical protein
MRKLTRDLGEIATIKRFLRGRNDQNQETNSKWLLHAMVKSLALGFRFYWFLIKKSNQRNSNWKSSYFDLEASKSVSE